VKDFPTDVYDALETTATDMLTPGFDYLTGHGLAQVDAAGAIVDCTSPDVYNLELTTVSPET
jgi:hypothetical protein